MYVAAAIPPRHVRDFFKQGFQQELCCLKKLNSGNGNVKFQGQQIMALLLRKMVLRRHKQMHNVGWPKYAESKRMWTVKALSFVFCLRETGKGQWTTFTYEAWILRQQTIWPTEDSASWPSSTFLSIIMIKVTYTT